MLTDITPAAINTDNRKNCFLLPLIKLLNFPTNAERELILKENFLIIKSPGYQLSICPIYQNKIAVITIRGMLVHGQQALIAVDSLNRMNCQRLCTTFTLVHEKGTSVFQMRHLMPTSILLSLDSQTLNSFLDDLMTEFNTNLDTYCKYPFRN